MKWIVMGLVAILVFLAQSVFIPTVFGRPWEPDLILVVFIVLATFRHTRLALWIAIIGGLVQDTVISDFFGLHFFPYLLVYYGVSRWAPRVYEEQWYLTIATVVVAALADCLIRLIFVAFTGAEVHLLTYLWHFTLPELIADGIIGWILHKIMWRSMAQEEYRW